MPQPFREDKQTMTKLYKTLLCSVGITMMLGGCSDMNGTNTNEGNKKDNQTQTSSSSDSLVSVQDYKGDGYALPYGKETDRIAKENRDQIEETAIAFFQQKYKTEVIVHNVVGAKDGATIFVESINEPHFYTYAVIPVDESEREVMFDQIWADEFQVKNAIKGGLYHMIFKEEFENLDAYLDLLSEEKQLTGKTTEAIQKVGGHGYQTPLYFISMTSKEAAIEPVYELYINNPNESIQNLTNAFEEDLLESKNIFINIQLFMSDKEAKPSKELFEDIKQELEDMNSIPKGSYSLVLNDNFIDKQSSSGMGENSIDTLKNIVKE